MTIRDRIVIAVLGVGCVASLPAVAAMQRSDPQYLVFPAEPQPPVRDDVSLPGMPGWKAFVDHLTDPYADVSGTHGSEWDGLAATGMPRFASAPDSLVLHDGAGAGWRGGAASSMPLRRISRSPIAARCS